MKNRCTEVGNLFSMSIVGKTGSPGLKLQGGIRGLERGNRQFTTEAHCLGGIFWNPHHLEFKTRVTQNLLEEMQVWLVAAQAWGMWLHQVLTQGLFQSCSAEAFVSCVVIEVIDSSLRL